MQYKVPNFILTFLKHFFNLNINTLQMFLDKYDIFKSSFLSQIGSS